MIISKDRYRRLLQDIEDMNSYHSFDRCPNPECRRLMPRGYCCPSCGYDGVHKNWEKPAAPQASGEK